MSTNKFPSVDMVDEDVETQMIDKMQQRADEAAADFLDAYRYFKVPPTHKVAISGTMGRAGIAIDNMKLNANGRWSVNDDGQIRWVENDAPDVHPVVVCDHLWVDVGFQFSKFVCSKCNKDREY